MAKFRDMKTLQKFAAAYASIHNHFNHDRTSTAATSSNRIVLPPLPSGVSWRPEHLRSAPFAGPSRCV